MGQCPKFFSRVLETYQANVCSFDWDVLEVCRQPLSTSIVRMLDSARASHTLFVAAILKACTMNVAY